MGSAAAKMSKLSSTSSSSTSRNSSSLLSSSSDSSSSLYRQRRAHHAGSWYQKDAAKLDATLQEFLDKVNHIIVDDDDDDSAVVVTAAKSAQQAGTLPLLRAVICPHAGFSYSGPTAAYSYKAVEQALSELGNPIQTILVLHPSHHVYLNGCAVSGAMALETPLGDLPVNDALRQEILALSSSTNNKDGCTFSTMTQSTDEHEHSGEMQYPFLRKVISNAAAAAKTMNNNHNNTSTADDGIITVLPVMCGSLSVEQETAFGRLLADIIGRPEILTVVSTDFCHWGARFQYRPACTTTNTASNDNNGGGEHGPSMIHELIEQLDRRGMSLIEAQQPGAFATYLKETKNTICGRHAVAVWLRAVEALNNNKEDDDDEQLNVQFIRYAQSSSVASPSESSVSYAAAIATSTTSAAAASLPN